MVSVYSIVSLMNDARAVGNEKIKHLYFLLEILTTIKKTYFRLLIFEWLRFMDVGGAV